ncbi:MAG: nucleotidyltransferase domain-containing protein [Deltaproteobacteria bacterium]|uniref:nucleotidyltransferase domain-containing protein n=1 Tax=Desulfobacula sp. TaxID=2593537 RepID=UPI0019CF30AB|nr:nucleotidyltransferase domain-containing protein [Candidatus Desulfobacula maris]MBL6995482.1 nucleotidyltransferase domain-containing protein [Desulfobacula sp.]
MDILSEILSSRIRAAILRLLFGFDAKELYMRDLERRSGFSIGAIQTELKKLLRFELVEKRKDGNRIYFQANKEHPLYSDLRNLVLKTNGLVDIIKDALIHSDAIRYAFIFGSFARKEETSSSDIDLMVVGDLGLRQLTKMLSGLSDKLYREINPHCLSEQDFINRKKAGEPFINRICEESRLFIIGDENDFAAMA